MSGVRWPVVSGAKPGSGHYDEFVAHPANFMLRAYRECGEFAEFALGGARHVLLSSPEASEAVFRAPDDQLSASEPYRFMVPVFGEGIQFGAPLELERQQVKMQANALRLDRMKSYASVIAREVEDWVAGWDDAGEMDFYDALKGLVLHTSTHCLMGSEFRAKLTDEFGALYQDLEHAISAESILDPYGQQEAFGRRDRSRARLVELITAVSGERRRSGTHSPDMLQSFMEAAYLDGRRLTDDEIAGMVIWIMFAGFHTSSNTATWTIVELARHPQHAARVVREVDSVYAPGGELGHTALRELPALERFVFEVLRVHPPLATLMRLVKRDFAFNGAVIPSGATIVVSRIRAAASEGDLHGVARALRVLLGGCARELPRRDSVVDSAHERAVPAAIQETREMRLRIVIDRDLCQGHGVCMGEAPDVFLVVERAGDYGQAQLLLDSFPEAVRAQVEAAVRYCPNRALKIVEEP